MKSVINSLVFIFLNLSSLDAQNLITGKVIDFDMKQPIDSATVSGTGKGAPAITNFKGFFQIEAEINDVLTVTGKGYQKKDVLLTVKSGVLISLRKIFVAPYEGGSDPVYKFLGNNLTYPAGARQQQKQGMVYISFTVNADGEASDFEVVKDIGYGCAKEVIRVLKKLPAKWAVAEKTVFILPVTFRMEEIRFEPMADTKLPPGILMTELVVTGYQR